MFLEGVDQGTATDDPEENPHKRLVLSSDLKSKAFFERILVKPVDKSSQECAGNGAGNGGFLLHHH